MIVVEPNDTSSSSDTNKWAANVKDRPLTRNEQHDQPPSYLDTRVTVSTTSSKSNPGTNHPSSIPYIKPSNFMHLNRANGSIKGSWLIDPSLSIPSSFLPPPPTEGARSNLILESKNGAIDADIFLLSNRHSTSKFIVIHTHSSNGSVKTRLHDTKSLNGQIRLPVRLFTRSTNGSMHVQLPRSFRGPIRIRTINGNTHFSAAMEAYLTTFSELDHVQRSFLGHLDASQLDIGVPWEGDELSIESKNGSVKISFDDEGYGVRGESFLSKLLSELSL